MRRAGLLASALVSALIIASAAAAQAPPVGTIAGLAGSGEIGLAGVWTAAAVGTEVRLGDTIRTGHPGRMRVVFRDDSVLTIGDDTEMVIDEQMFDPSQGAFSTVIRLMRGKVRALVSEYYTQPRASYHVETATAVIGVRGTEFVALFDPARDVTEVVGVYGRVAVHSVFDRVANGVILTAREATSVARGELPTPPRELDDSLFRQYLDGLAFMGPADADSLIADQPLLTGAAVPQEDRAASMPAPVITTTELVQSPQLPTEIQPTTPGDVINDPPAQVTDQGQLGIDF